MLVLVGAYSVGSFFWFSINVNTLTFVARTSLLVCNNRQCCVAFVDSYMNMIYKRLEILDQCLWAYLKVQ